MKATRGEKIFNGFNMTFMVVFSFLCLYPFINILAISFNQGQDSLRGGIYFLPRLWTLDNYSTIFQNKNILNSFMISVSRTVLGASLSVAVNSMFAFALAKRTLPGRKFFNWLVMIPMFFGGGLIPYFIICRSLGLVNNFLVFVIPWAYSPFYILMLRVYFLGMPDSIEESAKISGAGYFTIFWRLYFPLAMPAIATIALLSGIALWNDWYDGTVMVNKNSLWPLQTLLLNITIGTDLSQLLKGKNLQMSSFARHIQITAASVKAAMLIITVLPIVCIYPFLQKYFIKGMMIGSIKG